MIWNIYDIIVVYVQISVGDWKLEAGSRHHCTHLEDINLAFRE